MDIGGGTGTLANILQLAGAKVTLLDPSLEMTKQAREKNKDVVIYRKTLQELNGEIQQEYFDKIIIRDTLHHIPKVDEVLALSHKYLKPEGEIVIWEFNINSFKSKFICACEVMLLEKTRMFTPDGLNKLCSPYFEKIELNLYDGFEMLYKGRKKKLAMRRIDLVVG